MVSILLDVFNLSAFLPFLKVSEDDIGRNMRTLKKKVWFQRLLTNDKFRNLIIYDRDIRRLIGRCNTKRLQTKMYDRLFRRKLHKRLVKKTTTAVT